jgi:hypothetical protein
MMKRNLLLTLLIVALGLSVVSLAATGINRGQTTTPAMTDALQSSSAVSQRSGKAYIHRGTLSQRLRSLLSALGNRLENPGKERLTVTGTLSPSVDRQSREVVAVFEFPDQLRLVIQNSLQVQLITFDGQRLKATASRFEPGELDLIETLAYDSAEHFFATRLQGKAMRFLGARFRSDDGSSPDYNGPYFDIYQIADQIEASGEERAAKLYYFNSDTLLLERVTYVINRNGSEVNVETKLSDWRIEEGQKVARRIERLENGKSVFVLDLRSPQFGRRADDGIFGQ